LFWFRGGRGERGREVERERKRGREVERERKRGRGGEREMRSEERWR
jgi:hypothetical protein